MTTATWTTLPFGPLDQLCVSLGLRDLTEARVLDTAEGEYAVVAKACRDDVPVSVGIVYGDGTVDALVCAAGVGDAHVSAAELESAVRTRSLGLPTRPRRYLHAPPPGWACRCDHRVSIYESPDGDAAIAVYPSVPSASVDDAWRIVTNRILEAGARITRTFQSVAIEVKSMLGILREFEGTTVTGEPARWAFAALSDGFTAYPIVLSAPKSIDHRIADFANVVDSVTQLPRPFATNSFAHWVY